MSGQAISVTELNNYIKGLVEQDAMLTNVCVRGELSNYKIYPSGHHYFTLKDSESSLRCVMFKSSASKLRFRPESGMGVTAWGRVAVYPRDVRTSSTARHSCRRARATCRSRSSS